MSKVIELNDDNFNEKVNQLDLFRDTFVLIDFYGKQCGPCKMMEPILNELSIQYEGGYVFGKVDVAENQKLTTKYGVRAMPTILIFKNGVVVDKVVGATTRGLLMQKLDNQLNF